MGIKSTPSSPKDYISRFANVLHLSPKTQNEAIKILGRAENSELTSGRGPAGIAAAALYVAALLNDEKKTQREVADVAGITEVTIRNRYKELLDRLNLEEKMKIKEAESKTEKEKNQKEKTKPIKEEKSRKKKK
jgi:transcription initiation factor TFIIB